MPYHHQQQRCPHGNYYCTGQMAVDQSRASSEMTNEGFDPVLFALATALPMSCFPIDNVHPSARYGAPEDNRYQDRSTIHYSSTCCDSVTPFPSYLQNRCCGRCRMNAEYLFDSMPPLSASTVSSGWRSNWSSSEPATEFGIAGTFDAMPLSRSHGHFSPSQSYPTAPCNFEIFPDYLDIVAQDQPEHAWNGFASCDLGSAVPEQFGQAVEGQMPYTVISSGLSLDPFAEISHDVPENGLLPAAGLSPASDLVQQYTKVPPSTGLITPDYSPSHIDKEVDAFLDELAGVINWNDVEPGDEDPEINHMDIADQHTNGVDDTSLLGHRQQQAQQLDQVVAADSQDIWERELLAAASEISPAFGELLDDDNHYLRSPSSLDL